MIEEWDVMEEALNPPNRGFDVRERGGTDVVVFRPTEGTVWSWMWNLFVAPFQGIHLGFGGMYVGMVNRVLKVLEIRERRRGARWPVVFTGFSRGGALAEMCATDPLFSPWKPRAVSVAAPRWSLRRFPQAPVVRIEVEGDWVCSLPPWPYQKVGEVRKYKAKKWRFPWNLHRYSVYREAVYGS